MKNIISILKSKYPITIERIEGQLVFLDKYEVIRLDLPILQQTTKLEFFKAKFFTGYRKFTTIDVVVGLLTGDAVVYLLTNPLFSERYSSLVEQLEKIKSDVANQILISEIISMYKETGSNITVINKSKNKYQIWFGKHKWRVMHIETGQTIKLKTKPNSHISKALNNFFRFNFIK